MNDARRRAWATRGTGRALALSAAVPIAFLLSCSSTSGPRHDGGAATPRTLPAAEPSRLEASLRDLTAKPHLAGTAAQRRTAEYVRDRMLAFGLESEILEYEVLLPHPRRTQAELLSPVAFQARMIEEAAAGDPDTRNETAVQPFLAWSANGAVTAPLVYVNYGRPEDFAALETLGVSPRGAIAIARYGRNYRGVKVKIAEERGCSGILIYSDPADDGPARGDVYPKGPWRPPTAVQRGSIVYSHIRPGDPTTPGVPSLPGVARTAIEDLDTLPSIVAVPLSAADAEPFLRSLEGPAVPDGWQGGFSFPYRAGGTPATVASISVEQDRSLRKIWNTVATLRGFDLSDEVVLAGNHRDAWVHGAADPSSGTAVLLEAARLLALEAAEGRRPRRTIRFATWDAEEFGLVGSTEYGEHRRDELSRSTVLYVNCDTAVTGDSPHVSGPATLRRFVAGVLAGVPDGDGGTLLDRVRGDKPDFTMGLLGGGSDFAVFQNHLGIPCLDVASSGPYGVYHSGFDTFGWMKSHGDPTFEHHARVATLLASLLRAAADSPILPLDHDAGGAAMLAWLTEIETIRPGLDTAPLRRRIEAIREVQTKVDSALAASPPDAAGAHGTALRRLSTRLERSLLTERGLPGRPFMRHLLFAPDTATGYGVSTFPRLREAAAAGQAADIAAAIEETGATLAALESALRALLAAATTEAPPAGPR